MEGILQHEWFRKHYKPTRMYLDNDIKIDNIEALFEPEVSDSYVAHFTIFDSKTGNYNYRITDTSQTTFSSDYHHIYGHWEHLVSVIQSQADYGLQNWQEKSGGRVVGATRHPPTQVVYGTKLVCSWTKSGDYEGKWVEKFRGIVGCVFHLDEGLIISSSQPPSRAARALSGHNYH